MVLAMVQLQRFLEPLRSLIGAHIGHIKILCFVLLLAPLGQMIYWVFYDPFALGADPGRALVLELGFWAMVCLWLSLSVTPLRQWLSIPSLIRLRKMFGLFASFYTALHLLGFIGLMMGWQWDLIIPELYERPYVLFGVIATIGLVPLTVTSTKGMQKRLGRRWKVLHQLVYIIAICVGLHYLLQIRAGFGEHLFYLGWLALLLIARKEFFVRFVTKK